MNNIQSLLKRHSTLIMTIVASAGVVTTTVLAVKATPKAVKKLSTDGHLMFIVVFH